MRQDKKSATSRALRSCTEIYRTSREKAKWAQFNRLWGGREFPGCKKRAVERKGKR